MAVALAVPTLTVGLQLDDHVHQVLVQHMRETGVPARWWDMFRLADGEPDHMWPRIHHGTLPWWTLPDLKLAFFRPLPSLTHYLDYTLWPGAIGFMHGFNIVLYAAVVVAVGLLYRRLVEPAWAGGLAVALFAIDDSHGPVVGWIANRHALMATLGVALTLWAHDRAVHDQRRWPRWLGPGIFALALACGEIAVVVVPILGLHAIILDGRSARERWAQLVPYALLAVGWMALYVALDYGAFGSGAYVDPLADLRAFVTTWSHRIPAYLWGLFFYPTPEAWLLWNHRQIAWAAAGVLVAWLGLGWVLAPWFRCDPSLRFWAWASVVALVPACIVLPADRMLFLPGVFAYGFMARVAALACGDDDLRLSPWIRRVSVTVVLLAWLVIHGVVAPVQFPVRGAWIPRQVDALHRGAAASLPRDDLSERTVVVVGGSDPFLGAYLWTLRVGSGRQPPKRIRVLGVAPGVSVLKTIGPRTIEIESLGPPLSPLMARLVRDPDHALSRGDTVPLDGLTITVLETSSGGLPSHVRFQFSVPVESAELLWLRWHGFRLHPFKPPPVGQSTAL